MAGSGIVEVLSKTFSGVLKMLTGKKYPDKACALRMLVEELIKPFFQTQNKLSMDDLQQVLNDTASHSRTAKLWVNCLIKPIFTIMKYVRAERETDWPLHLASVHEIMPSPLRPLTSTMLATDSIIYKKWQQCQKMSTSTS
jgi:hypothetical protein